MVELLFVGFQKDDSMALVDDCRLPPHVEQENVHFPLVGGGRALQSKWHPYKIVQACNAW